MPRLAVRRKAATTATASQSSTGTNNNAGEDDVDAPKRKMARMPFKLPLPEPQRILGRALVCGLGDMGQLGLGEDKTECKRPVLLDSIKNVVDVRAGGMHNIVLTHDGRIFSFGCNDEGALGRDSSDDGAEFEPREVQLPGKVIRISAGDSHSACLLEDGRVYAWGSFRDSHGNMGLTMEGNKRLPIDVLPSHMCCDIASGADHLVILTCAGKVYTVGCAEQGQLGRVSLRSASGESRRGKSDLLRPGPVLIKRSRPIDAIWATNYCTFLRETQTNKIWAFGLNNYRQLALIKGGSSTTVINPIDTNFENVQQIAGGQHHTLVLKTDGTCYVIGRRDYGRLGLGTLEDDVTELQAIRALDGKRIVSVSCGEAQSFALGEDGKLYAWGMGSNLQLGTGSEDDALEPVLIASKQTTDKRIIRASSGGQHSIFLVEDEEQEPTQSKSAAAVTAATSAVAPAVAMTKKAAAAAAAKEKEAKRAAEEAEDKQQQQQDNVVSTTAITAAASVVDEANTGTSSKANNVDQDGDVELPEAGKQISTESVASSDTAITANGKAGGKRGRKKK